MNAEHKLTVIIGLLTAIFVVLLVELVIKPSVQPVRWDVPITDIRGLPEDVEYGVFYDRDRVIVTSLYSTIDEKVPMGIDTVIGNE